MFEAQQRRFEEKFGRPPGPDDPVFFDRDADEPRPDSVPGMESATVAMLEAAGISSAWIYAYQHTGGLLPRPDGSFASKRDNDEWGEAVGRYMRLHEPDHHVDHEDETRKLQDVLVAMTLKMAADDPHYARSLVARLAAPQADTDSEASALRYYLRAWADDLTTHLRGDPAVLSTACEYARAWDGADLADRVQSASSALAGDTSADAALLAIAVAVSAEQPE